MWYLLEYRGPGQKELIMPRLDLISGSKSPPLSRKCSYLALSLCLITSAISLHSQPVSALDPTNLTSPASETLSESSQAPVTIAELTRKLDQLKTLVAEIEKITKIGRAHV